jgi:transcriptional regulator with XRE-family HTH domain
VEVTTPITHAEYAAAKQASAMLAGEPTYARNTEQDAWLAVLEPARSGSSGIVTLVTDYGPILPHVGSSSFIVDRRSARRAFKSVVSEGSTGFREVVALSVGEQMQELSAALSLNKSQLAQILRVTRPTMYDWFQGKEPNAANAERIHSLLRILARSGVSGATPLNSRFVCQPMELDEPSLIDLLRGEQLDENRVVGAIEQALALGGSASRKRKEREERLRALGFEEPSSEQRKEQLAKNVALQDWPKR